VRRPLALARTPRASDAHSANRFPRVRARAVNERTEQLQRLEAELLEQAKSWRLYPVVEAVQALRGVQFTVAITALAELGELTRFECKRYRRLLARGKHRNTIAAAIARELVAFMWAIARQCPKTA
jgi:hypothetical protein